jgi:K+-transporting ATPase ATPase C chain
MSHLQPAVILLIVLTVLTGAVYPLVITGLAQLVFPVPANGSLIEVDGKPVGSRLIGQPFTAPHYFWSRLSATAPHAYNAGASSGSNLGPLNPGAREAAAARVQALRTADPESKNPIPVDLVTASASGLDPHISPAAALFQVPRVARARGMDEDRVRRLVERHIEGRKLGILGEPQVNVLSLNLALDKEAR